MQSHYRTALDKLIREFVNDPNYLILWSGEIMTRRDLGGHVKDVWRSCLIKHKSNRTSRDLYYWRVRYKGKQISAHRIIYQKFIGELDSSLDINHIDGDGLNNAVENIELVTASENGKHRFRVLGHKPVIGNFKINQKIADQIRKDRAKGLPYSALCARYKLSKGTISQIINNKIWKIAA